ncbi:MAG: hypothetical protein DLM53_08995 [Candidatus Eremiobacter antarcticus]|nr:MAG: hypothetical protein DLM53_08995 [Candidatus Eremiobacter sp. RRmetagenome_bin22]
MRILGITLVHFLVVVEDDQCRCGAAEQDVAGAGGSVCQRAAPMLIWLRMPRPAKLPPKS